MGLIDRGLAEMEISARGESSTKTRSRKEGITRNPLPTSIEQLRKMFNEREEQFCRDYGIPFEKTAPPTEEQEIEDYRKFWERCYGPRFGSFDSETSLGPMYCSNGAIPEFAHPERSLQFFSIKVTDLSYDLSWP